MTVLAYGAERVRNLETALGGKPPKDGAKRAAAELDRHVREQFKHRKANLAKVNRLLEKQRAPLLELLNLNKRAAVSVKEMREMLPQPPAKRRERPPREKIEPRMVTGSGFWLKAPPYDGQGQNTFGDAQAAPDALNGTYTLSMTGNGGTSSAWAGLAINFFAQEDDPSQRFAALVDYDYQWSDYSDFSTAHNDGATNIWVWGYTENRWVLKQGGLTPSWSDGTGWGEHHGSGGDGSEQFGRESLEVFFPAFGGNWYQAWVWSRGSCDDAGFNSPLPSSQAQQSQYMQVPLVFFGSL